MQTSKKRSLGIAAFFPVTFSLAFVIYVLLFGLPGIALADAYGLCVILPCTVIAICYFCFDLAGQRGPVKIKAMHLSIVLVFILLAVIGLSMVWIPQ